MTAPETKWTAIAPGIMELPTTKYLIRYEHGSAAPYRVTWDGQPIPDGCHSQLYAAQGAAERHMADQITMGFEP